MEKLVETLTVTALIVTVMLALIPEDGLKRIIAGVGTAMILMALLLRGKEIDVKKTYSSVSDWENLLDEKVQTYGERIEDELRETVREKTEKIIEEKAQEMGLICEAGITLEGEDSLEIAQVEIFYADDAEEDAARRLRNWLTEYFKIDYDRQRHIKNG